MVKNNKKYNKQTNNNKTKKNIVIAILVLAVISIVVMSFSNSKQNTSGLGSANLAGPAITIYKDASCGCCGVFASYMMRNDYDVTLDQDTPVDSIKSKYNIPNNLRSCHTSLIGDYYVEGHIPEEAINKLMTEKPEIAGIAMPGMPSGSPGMPGTKKGDFVITAVKSDGSTYEFMRI